MDPLAAHALDVRRFVQQGAVNRKRGGASVPYTLWQCLYWMRRVVGASMRVLAEHKPPSGATRVGHEGGQAPVPDPDLLLAIEAAYSTMAIDDPRKGPLAGILATWTGFMRFEYAQRAISLSCGSQVAGAYCLRGKKNVRGYKWSFTRRGITSADYGGDLWRHWLAASKRAGRALQYIIFDWRTGAALNLADFNKAARDILADCVANPEEASSYS